MQKRLLTKKEASRIFGFTRQTIHNWINRSLIPLYIIGPKKRTYVCFNDLEEFIKKRGSDYVVNNFGDVIKKLSNE